MDKEEKRSSYVRVRLTPEESDRLKKMSKEQRRSKSEIIRMGLDLLFSEN